MTALDDARAALDAIESEEAAYLEQITTCTAERAAAYEMVATLEDRVALLSAAAVPDTVFGFDSPSADQYGARVRRVFLDPGEAFPSYVPGTLAVVTYKGASDHSLRCDQAAAYAGPLLLGFHHEPEGEWEAEAYRAEWRTFGSLAPPNARRIAVFMASAFDSGTAQAMFPEDGYVDVVGADGYNFCGCRGDGGGYYKPGATSRAPSKVFGAAWAFAAGAGLQLALCEIGMPAKSSGDEAERTAWIDTLIQFVRDTNAVAACYFDKTVAEGFLCNYALAGTSLDHWRAVL